MAVIHNYDVKLYKNNLTSTDNLYYARPAADRTLSISDVAELAVTRGDATTDAAQMITAVQEWLNEAVYDLMDGFCINNGYEMWYLSMEGNFNGTTDTYDSTRHKLKVVCVPLDKIRDELENVVVNVVGLADTEPKITQVTDLSNGNVNTTLTPGTNLCIEGSRIKVTGDDASCGVYLTNADDGTQTQLTGYSIPRNEPTQLWILVPADLASGSYTVSVTTQYSSQNYSVKSPRSVEFDTVLTVG